MLVPSWTSGGSGSLLSGLAHAANPARRSDGLDRKRLPKSGRGNLLFVERGVQAEVPGALGFLSALTAPALGSAPGAPEAPTRLGRSRSTPCDQIERVLSPEPMKVGRTSCRRSDEVDAHTAGFDRIKLLALCRSIAERRGQVTDKVGRLLAPSG